MAELVLVELRCLHHVAGRIGFRLDIYLDLTTDTTSLGMPKHVVVKLLQGVLIGSCSNIKHQSELRLDILADSLEEPLVRVDFTIVALFDTEHKVDTSTFQYIRLVMLVFVVEIEVPCSHLEAMKKVGGEVLFLHAFIAYIAHVLHLKLLVAVHFHEAFLEELLFIKEALFACQLFKTLRNALIAIADDDHEEVILCELGLLVHLHAVVVV